MVIFMLLQGTAAADLAEPADRAERSRDGELLEVLQKSGQKVGERMAVAPGDDAVRLAVPRLDPRLPNLLVRYRSAHDCNAAHASRREGHQSCADGALGLGVPAVALECDFHTCLQ
jgi:hypothetical protein